MTINNRIAHLRAQMTEKGIDAYIIPSADAHQSEYVPAYYKGREWISGFSGSAGTVIITQDHAGLWTDSRYFLQAERELSETEVILHKLSTQPSSHYTFWLTQMCGKDTTIGFDPKTITIKELENLKRHLPKGTKFYTKYDLLEHIWDNRPPLPTENVYEFAEAYTGVSRKEKIATHQRFIQDRGADYLIIPTLDDIAWIFNIRGSDVDFNPVTVAHAVIGAELTHLFIDESKLNPLLSDRLLSDDIHIHDYKEIGSFLDAIDMNAVVLLDPSITSVYLHNKILSIIERLPLPTRKWKAIKNETELRHIGNAMIKDGVALTKAFMWLEESLEKNTVSEYDFARKIAECRATQKDYKGESFNAIVGYKENGAIVHYGPTPEGSAEIEKNGILLCDSGGHYLDGTTDITRTIHLSPASIDIKKHYTLVLKGHIGLASAIFPEGTKGVQLDIEARKYLWQEGLNYGHGTGHGVGFFLNVHEPPQGFNAAIDMRGKTSIEPGMLSSNEPGHYVEGEYGIRIENLMVCVKSEEHEGFLEHKTLTLFPIDTELILLGIMTKQEIKWLNAYHRKVKRTLSPHLNEKERLWIESKTEAIELPIS